MTIKLQWFVCGDQCGVNGLACYGCSCFRTHAGIKLHLSCTIVISLQNLGKANYLRNRVREKYSLLNYLWTLLKQDFKVDDRLLINSSYVQNFHQDKPTHIGLAYSHYHSVSFHCYIQKEVISLIVITKHWWEERIW